MTQSPVPEKHPLSINRDLRVTTALGELLTALKSAGEVYMLDKY